MSAAPKAKRFPKIDGLRRVDQFHTRGKIMWLFGNSRKQRFDVLSDAQIAGVAAIVYGERDIGCWYARVDFKQGESVRLAASSEAGARECARDFARQVLYRSGTSIDVKRE